MRVVKITALVELDIDEHGIPADEISYEISSHNWTDWQLLDWEISTPEEWAGYAS